MKILIRKFGYLTSLGKFMKKIGKICKIKNERERNCNFEKKWDLKLVNLKKENFV